MKKESISLNLLNNKYKEIMESNLSDHEKSIEYAKLMTIMEKVFNIPLLQDKEYERNNKAVISLYRKISISRKKL